MTDLSILLHKENFQISWIKVYVEKRFEGLLMYCLRSALGFLSIMKPYQACIQVPHIFCYWPAKKNEDLQGS